MLLTQHFIGYCCSISFFNSLLFNQLFLWFISSLFIQRFLIFIHILLFNQHFIFVHLLPFNRLFLLITFHVRTFSFIILSFCHSLYAIINYYYYYRSLQLFSIVVVFVYLQRSLSYIVVSAFLIDISFRPNQTRM